MQEGCQVWKAGQYGVGVWLVVGCHLHGAPQQGSGREGLGYGRWEHCFKDHVLEEQVSAGCGQAPGHKTQDSRWPLGILLGIFGSCGHSRAGEWGSGNSWGPFGVIEVAVLLEVPTELGS